jgi:hypothetical protein
MKFLRGGRRYMPVTLNNNWVVEYPTDTDEVLRVNPAEIRAEYRIGIVRDSASGHNCLLGCRVRVADERGRLWVSDSCFSPHVFFHAMFDLTSRRRPRWVRTLAGIVSAERLVRCEGSIPNHGDYHFYLDGQGCAWDGDWAGARFSLVKLEGGLVVLAENQFGCWSPFHLQDDQGEPIPPPSPPTLPPEDEEGHLDTFPPIAYPIDLQRLLFRNRQLSEGPEQDNETPLPVVFRLGKGSGMPQPVVTVAPRTTRAPRPAELGEFHRLWMSNCQRAIELPTSAGGILLVTGEQGDLLDRYDAEIDACFDLAPGSERELVDVVRCRLRVADSRGRLWEATTHFTADVLLQAWCDWYNSPPSFESPTRSLGEILLGDVRGLLDGGGWRHLLIDDWAVSIPFDGQRPRFDLTAWKDVRVRGLVGYRRRVKMDFRQLEFEWDDPGPGATVLMESLPPIVFNARELLFRNTTFAVDDGFWHHNDLPIPVVFEPLDATGEPQANVVFTPHASPR